MFVCDPVNVNIMFAAPRRPAPSHFEMLVFYAKLNRSCVVLVTVGLVRNRRVLLGVERCVDDDFRLKVDQALRRWSTVRFVRCWDQAFLRHPAYANAVGWYYSYDCSWMMSHPSVFVCGLQRTYVASDVVASAETLRDLQDEMSRFRRTNANRHSRDCTVAVDDVYATALFAALLRAGSTQVVNTERLVLTLCCVGNEWPKSPVVAQVSGVVPGRDGDNVIKRHILKYLTDFEAL